MDPTIPPNHFVEYEPEPVKAMPYTGPKPMKVLVPGKPMNRAYRRAEASSNKKAKVALGNKNAVRRKVAATQIPRNPLLQPTPETASEATPFTPESTP